MSSVDNLCKQSVPRSTSGLIWIQLFDIQMVFLKEFFEKVSKTLYPLLSTGPEVIKHFVLVGILTFISMVNKTSESLNSKKILYFSSILVFMSNCNFVLSWVEREKSFITWSSGSAQEDRKASKHDRKIVDINTKPQTKSWSTIAQLIDWRTPTQDIMQSLLLHGIMQSLILCNHWYCMILM